MGSQGGSLLPTERPVEASEAFAVVPQLPGYIMWKLKERAAMQQQSSNRP